MHVLEVPQDVHGTGRGQVVERTERAAAKGGVPDAEQGADVAIPGAPGRSLVDA